METIMKAIEIARNSSDGTDIEPESEAST